MSDKKVLIVDDEADSRLLIRQYLEEYQDFKIAAECKNGLEAVLAIDQYEPDMIFLDIQMPGLSGFQVLQKIVHIPQIIFSTALDKYALKAFEHNAIDYLLKPYTRDRFKQALDKVIISAKKNLDGIQMLNDHLQQGTFPERLLANRGNKLIGIHISDIIWLEADGDYVRIHTAQQQYLSSTSMTALEQKLNPSVFVRIHRSAIVNMNHIIEVHKEPGGPHIVLSNNSIHKVSRTYSEALKRMML